MISHTVQHRNDQLNADDRYKALLSPMTGVEYTLCQLYEYRWVKTCAVAIPPSCFGF